MKVRDLKENLKRIPDDFDIVIRDNDDGYVTFSNQFSLKGEVVILVQDEYYHSYDSLVQEIK